MVTKNRPRGPLRRLSGDAAAEAQIIFESAMVLLKPEDQTQRKAFRSLMPYLYVLRDKGCSWAQLTKLLAQTGLYLEQSTVRVYYSEMLADRQEICQERMNEHVLLMAELRKQTQGIELTAISSRVATTMANQRVQGASKVKALLGPVAAPVSPALIPAPSAPSQPSTTPVTVVPIAGTPGLDNKNTGLGPAPNNQNKAITQPVNGAIPTTDTRRSVAPSDTGPENTNMRCVDLPPGVALLKRREGVPEFVYQPGELEHTVVTGVMLSLEQRLSSLPLEFVNLETGEIRPETPEEKRLRITWRKIVPMSKSSTAHTFTQIDESLFTKYV